jgi:hypothetical protein
MSQGFSFNQLNNPIEPIEIYVKVIGIPFKREIKNLPTPLANSGRAP